MKIIRSIFVFILLLLSLNSTLLGQTYSSEEIVISGLGFARFSISLEPSASFSQHKNSEKWLRIIDRNLCWSGVFLIADSRYSSCRIANNGGMDMKILLQLKTNNGTNTSSNTNNNKKVPEELMLTIADNEGIPIFPLKLPLERGRFKESNLMELVNEISTQLTGLPGVLGSTLAFTVKQTGRRKIIARVNTHGKKLAAISRNPYISMLPDWSPNGDAIIYTTLSRRGTSIIYDDLDRKKQPVVLLTSNNSAERASKNFLSVSGGTWFADGNRLIVTLSRRGNTDLFEFDRRWRRETRLTTHRAIDTVPDISPDSQRLVYVSDRTGKEQIYYLQLGTKIPFQLTFGRGGNSDPAWSPDGTLIAYSKIVRGNSQIFLMEPFTGKEWPLTKGAYNSEQPSWSPDGRQIAYASSSTGVYKLYIMFIDGTGRRRLTRTPKDFEESAPSWTLRKF